MAVAPYSPPTENACRQRTSSISTGATAPTWAEVGSTAIKSDPIDISVTDVTIEVLRP